MSKLFLFLIIILIILFIFILICCIFGFNIRISKFDFRFDTFFKKGTPKIDDRFGCWFVTGKQGSNKNYYATYLLSRQNFNLLNKVKTNIHSLVVPGADMQYFNHISDIYYDTDDYCIYVIDEIAKKYNKSSKTDDQFYAWLNQSRKRKRIVILITQEWKELPMWLRRPAKYMFTSVPCPILGLFNIFICKQGDAENLIFNKDESEYECPIIRLIFYKRLMKYAYMYDTFESINTL